MSDIFSKIDASTLKRTITETRDVSYDYDFLLKQKLEAEAGLQEINDLLAQASLLGITSKILK